MACGMNGILKQGDLVERYIEGSWFLGRIEAVNYKLKHASIRYLDDHNIEDEIPYSELRKAEHSEAKSQDEAKSEGKENKDTIKTLPRPLAGLVDDDYETRNKMKTKVIVHEDAKDADTDETIILNGAENRLAAGGGLRALRYLRK